MSKHRVAVLKVVSSQSSVIAAAAEYGTSRGHLHGLLRHLVEPDRTYWRNKRRDPGRWPGSQATG